jgi:maltodextrin utilization protein YvdJ
MWVRRKHTMLLSAVDFHWLQRHTTSLNLIMWLGIACVAQQANAFLVLAGMTSYLLARGKNTNDYYLAEFDKDEWPPTRKAVIPYLL